MIALWATVVAALIAAVIAPWAKARIDSHQDEGAEAKVAKASLEKVTEARVERLFAEYDQLRKTYRSDLDDARAQIRDATDRIKLLEREVAEWRAGIHGVQGVWVAVPAAVMDWIRQNPPRGFPSTRFPGEAPEPGSIED